MPTSPCLRLAGRFGALGAAALLALAAAPAAVADDAVPGLVVGGVAPVDGVRPGGSFEVPVTVANKGTGAVGKVWILYTLTRGLDYADLPSNCRSWQVPAYDEATAKWEASCEFDQPVEPGTVYAPERPLTVKALGRAYHDVLSASVWDTVPGPNQDDGPTDPVSGTAPAVRLVEQPSGTAGTGARAEAPVTSVNTADFKVTGAHLKGKAGDTVPLTVKFTNAGPAWVLGKQDQSVVTVLVTPPAGTSVVKSDGYCEPKAGAEDGTYACGTGNYWMDENDGDTYTFELKINKAVPGAEGSVALADGSRPFDPDTSDDKATISLDTTGAGGTAGAGSTAGGSGSGSGTTPDGSLADTGSSNATLPIAALAAAAVAAGTGAIVAVRRRRSRAEA